MKALNKFKELIKKNDNVNLNNIPKNVKEKAKVIKDDVVQKKTR